MPRLLPDHSTLRLGFGCSGPLGKSWFSEAKAVALIRSAIERGVAHLDTAGFYGDAEARLGKVVAGVPEDKIFISTKTGTRQGQKGLEKDFSQAAIRSDVEASLKRLNRERLDLLYLHGPSAAQLAACEDILSRLKEEGKIHLAGVCGEGAGLAEGVAAPAIDVVMGAYNILRREHAGVFAEAKRVGKAVVAIEPLAQGLYRNDLFAPTNASELWTLARAAAGGYGRLARARKARAALSVPGWTQTGLALGFCLANPDVDIAVTTTTKRHHLQESLDVLDKTIPPETLKRLQALA